MSVTAMCMRLGRDNLNLVPGAAFGRVRSDSLHMQCFLISSARGKLYLANVSAGRRAVSVDALVQARSDHVDDVHEMEHRTGSGSLVFFIPTHGLRKGSFLQR